MTRIEGIALYQLRGVRERVVAPGAARGVRPADASENLLLVMASDGRCGVANWPSNAAEAGRAQIGWLVGRDPHALFSWDDGKVTGFEPECVDALRAVAPIDLALLDLCAQADGVPLWRILGNEVRDDVAVYDSTIYFDDLLTPESTPGDIVERAEEAVARGHRALKVRVGRGLTWMGWPECTERDVAVCRAVRDAVGPDVSLMVDADYGYAGYVADAVDFLVDTAECGFLFAEEMVADSEVGALMEGLQASGLRIPLAGGEDITTASAAERLLDRVPLGVLQADMVRTGVMEYLRIADVAEKHGAQVAPHNFGTCIGVYESVQIGKVAPAYLMGECDDSSFDAYSASGYILREGVYRVPDVPGFGVVARDPRANS